MVADIEPPRIRRKDVRTKLLFRATMQDDVSKVHSLVQTGVKWQTVTNKAGQTAQEVAKVAGKEKVLAYYEDLTGDARPVAAQGANP